MNFFQEVADKYDSWFRTQHGNYVYRHEHELINQIMSVQPGMVVADIGCGTGIYTLELCATGARVVGVDISPEMLAIAAEKNKKWQDNVSFVQADAASLPFDSESFDMVISITAMEFFDDPSQCLREMYRILRPGGSMVVATLNSLSLWSIQRRIKSIFNKTIFRNTHFYSLKNIKRLIAPLSIADWRGGIFVPPFVPQWLIEHPDKVEKLGQKLVPHFGTFIVFRVDKK